MKAELERTPSIIICNDLDGVMYLTEQFNNDIASSVSETKGQELKQEVQRYRKELGTSALMPFDKIIGDEMPIINSKINRQDYLYYDVERHIKMTQCGAFAVKHMILTQGTNHWQRFKVSGTLLENLPIEVRSTSDKVDFIASMFDEQKNMYRYQSSKMSEEYSAEYCFLIDDKVKSFKDSFDSFYITEHTPNFKGFLLTREGEYAHNIGQEISSSINQITSLDYIPGHINDMSVDYSTKIY